MEGGVSRTKRPLREASSNGPPYPLVARSHRRARAALGFWAREFSGNSVSRHPVFLRLPLRLSRALHHVSVVHVRVSPGPSHEHLGEMTRARLALYAALAWYAARAREHR